MSAYRHRETTVTLRQGETKVSRLPPTTRGTVLIKARVIYPRGEEVQARFSGGGLARGGGHVGTRGSTSSMVKRLLENIDGISCMRRGRCSHNVTRVRAQHCRDLTPICPAPRLGIQAVPMDAGHVLASDGAPSLQTARCARYPPWREQLEDHLSVAIRI